MYILATLLNLSFPQENENNIATFHSFMIIYSFDIQENLMSLVELSKIL